MDYCGCCQTAINNALAKIPVRYVKKFTYVSDQDEIDFLKNTFEEEKRKYEESKMTPFLVVWRKWFQVWDIKTLNIA
jgi:hypothetical protein